jgi:hypothetical protein
MLPSTQTHDAEDTHSPAPPARPSHPSGTQVDTREFDASDVSSLFPMYSGKGRAREAERGFSGTALTGGFVAAPPAAAAEAAQGGEADAEG